MDVVAQVIRSGLVESSHRGMAVRVDADGDIVWALGDPSTVMYPRSTSKPFQTLAMLRAGLGLEGRLLALASASHSAQDFHLDGVRQILAIAQLDESMLQTPLSGPRRPRSAIQHGCSGKHAAMLVASAINGWPLDSYLDPEHPLQLSITEVMVELTGVEPAVVAIDGCGAPQHATTLYGLAKAVSTFTHRHATGERVRIREAMTSFPEFVSGTRRPELAFMTAFPGLLAKSGAEAVFIVGLPQGGGVALKIEDGHERGMYAVMRRILELAGFDHPMLAERPPVLGGASQVGEIAVTF